ncbi:hypothetical protein CNEO4_10032 [Clostridium neonatale]|nr:hypothetical protein CNEO4_10032 [Clostridium neonatale]
MDLDRIKENMTGEYFFDLRNVYVKNKEIRNMFKYIPVGM